MPQPGYNAAGQAQGHVDAWGRYIANRPANLTSLIGGILNRGASGPAAAAGPRNPADVAPPGYSQAEWDAMSTTGPVVVRGRSVGGITGGNPSARPPGATDTRLSGPAYEAASRAQNAFLMANQAYGGEAGGPSGVSDEGHNVFTEGQHRRMMNENGELVALPERIMRDRGGHNTFAESMRLAGHPAGLLNYPSARPAPIYSGEPPPFVGPLPAPVSLTDTMLGNPQPAALQNFPGRNGNRGGALSQLLLSRKAAY